MLGNHSSSFSPRMAFVASDTIAAAMGAVPPIMLKTKANPGGLPMEVFDGFRKAYLADRAQFFLDVASGPFFNFNRPGAKVLQGLKSIVMILPQSLCKKLS